VIALYEGMLFVQVRLFGLKEKGATHYRTAPINPPGWANYPFIRFIGAMVSMRS